MLLGSVLLLPGAAVATAGGESASTTMPTLVTVTTAHRGAPGSHGKDLGTTTSSTAGTPVITTIGKTSPGAAAVQGSSVTAPMRGFFGVNYALTAPLTVQ